MSYRNFVPVYWVEGVSVLARKLRNRPPDANWEVPGYKANANVTAATANAKISSGFLLSFGFVFRRPMPDFMRTPNRRRAYAHTLGFEKVQFDCNPAAKELRTAAMKRPRSSTLSLVSVNKDGKALETAARTRPTKTVGLPGC